MQWGIIKKFYAGNYRQLCNLILFSIHSVILLIRIVHSVFFFNTKYFQNDVLDILGNRKMHKTCLTLKNNVLIIYKCYLSVQLFESKAIQM